MSTALAVIASSILGALALVHLYWAFGGYWPGDSESTLAETVVGPTPNGRMPSEAACVAVAGALLMAALLPLDHAGLVDLPLPGWITTIGFWGVAFVLGLRGIGGFFERALRPKIVGLRYDRLNRLIYSPLCLLLATLIVGVAWPA